MLTRGRALARARHRVQWLEEELREWFNVDCSSLPTGTSLRPLQQVSPNSREPTHVASTNLEGSWTDEQGHGNTEETGDGSPATNNAPDISLLAFNATGEMKYLGPSSGAFFATYATAVVRSFNSDQRSKRRGFSLAPNPPTNSGTIVGPLEEHRSLSSGDIQQLLRSYQMWIHPLHPLFDLESLETLISSCQRYKPHGTDELCGDSPRYSDMTLFYLVMALGAANYENLLKQEPTLIKSTSRPAPSYLYSKAMQFFDRNPRRLDTSICTIQTLLLISIYSSFGPVGSGQWQLAGLAMRVRVLTDALLS